MIEIDEAIAVGRAALSYATGDDAQHLSNLGIAIHARFDRTGTLADLDEGIALCRRAVETTPGPDQHRARYLSYLANGLYARYL